MNRQLISIIAAFFLVTGLRAQDLPAALKDCSSAVRTIDPGDTDYTDLSGLRAAVGSAHIVLLGEQTHGEGSTFTAKIRLIKFLHEKMGFEVLAFESGLYDCARIWENVQQGGNLSQEVIGSLFYMYATSVQTQPLFDYIQSELHGPHPLILTGFESQHTGVKAKTMLFNDFERFLRKEHPDVADEDFDMFRRVSVATFASRDYRPSIEEKARFLHKLTELQRTLADAGKVTDSLTRSAGFWYQVVNSIESQVTRYWQLLPGNEGSIRDLQMAKNLVWLAEKAYPGKKIIVWAHNGHIAKEMPVDGGRAASGADAFVPMGATIHRTFGSRAFCIGFTGSEGSYMNYVNDQIVSVAAQPAGSIEGTLAAAGYPFAFVDYRKASGALRKSQEGVLGDFGPMKAVWPDVFDGLFFVARVYPVERTGK